MMMFNRTTGEYAEWVTVEDVEFLKVDGGNFIRKDNVGTDWVEFDDQTSKMLLELADAVNHEEDVNFVLIKHIKGGAHVLGHRMSDRMVLSFIMALVEQFIEDDPIRVMMLMMAIQEVVEGE